MHLTNIIIILGAIVGVMSSSSTFTSKDPTLFATTKRQIATPGCLGQTTANLVSDNGFESVSCTANSVNPTGLCPPTTVPDWTLNTGAQIAEAGGDITIPDGNYAIYLPSGSDIAQTFIAQNEVQVGSTCTYSMLLSFPPNPPEEYEFKFDAVILGAVTSPLSVTCSASSTATTNVYQIQCPSVTVTSISGPVSIDLQSIGTDAFIADDIAWTCTSCPNCIYSICGCCKTQ